MNLPGAITRNLLFTGKGGVGKTSIASATAVSLADAGKRVLLVSTDPASNLDEVFGIRLSITPTPIDGVSGLFALNVDPVAAAKAYRARVVGPYRELLPDAALTSIEEQLSGACTVEIAAFEEFAKLLGDPLRTAEFDHVIFDTAPTGHTLRLLQLPAAWSDFIQTNTSGTSCLGPLAGLQSQREMYDATVRALSDDTATTVYLVARPEVSSLKEAERTQGELEKLGFCNQRLIVNGVFHSATPNDVTAAALEKRGLEALQSMPAALRTLPITFFPLVAHSLLGIEALRRFGVQDQSTGVNVTPVPNETSLPALDQLIPKLAVNSQGVILTMGKGGVGKTTVAAAVALGLARSGYQVLLTTTDPAAHFSMLVKGDVPGLTVTRIDPEGEVRKYTDEVMAESGRDLDEKGKALLEEDLRSPCTEEIAVFRAFAQAVEEGNHAFVVIDTAPTGHTLLLLDAAEAYHRDVARNVNSVPSAVRELLPQLRDADFTKILIVTIPEATPVHEAAALQVDLERAGINPYAWVINQSLLLTGTADPVLAKRADSEQRYIDEVMQLSGKVFLMPWQRDIEQLAESISLQSAEEALTN
jgi:arsenite-transporting ATPase